MFCNNVNTDCGIEFACESIDVAACNKMFELV